MASIQDSSEFPRELWTPTSSLPTWLLVFLSFFLGLLLTSLIG